MQLMLQSMSLLTVALVDDVSDTDVHAPAAYTPNVLAAVVNIPTGLALSALSQLWKLQKI